MLQHISDDSVLNDVQVQRALRDYWNQSDPNNHDLSKRREQGGYIFQDTVTGTYIILPMSSNRAAALCASTLDGNDVSPVFNSGIPVKLIATFHTHPHPEGVKPPSNCMATGASDPGAVFGDGASLDDYSSVNDDAWKIPQYIVDAKHVHRINPKEHIGDPDHVDQRSTKCK